MRLPTASFRGNPAAVRPLEAWLPDATMQAIAAENNLAETAFFVREGSDYALRWFTPTVEVDLMLPRGKLGIAYTVRKVWNRAIVSPGIFDDEEGTGPDGRKT